MSGKEFENSLCDGVGCGKTQKGCHKCGSLPKREWKVDPMVEARGRIFLGMTFGSLAFTWPCALLPVPHFDHESSRPCELARLRLCTKLSSN